MADDIPKREREVFLAQLAEQAERYEEMAEHMKVAVMTGEEPSAEERHLIAVAYKQAVGQRRASWSTVCAVEAEQEEAGNHLTTAAARKYRAQIENEIKKMCQTILSLLGDILIEGASTAEAKVDFYKAKGDYHRYIAAITDDRERTDQSKQARKAYEDGTTVAENALSVTNTCRLGLALNHAVFHYEVMKSPTEAVRIGRKAFEDAVRELDMNGHEAAQDSALIMQLLRDNLTLWTADSVDS
mmetsp:Transcript_128621/g.359925  ORF Transcript_128621/g.359925 Transcript_128621/m.359925 type:complete len:243 (+) Transcript_128621:69-797(+)